MLVHDAFQKILTSPGALIQSFNGDFFLFTNVKSNSFESNSSQQKSLPPNNDSTPKLFAPTFFNSNPTSSLTSFESCLNFERNELVAHLNKALAHHKDSPSATLQTQLTSPWLLPKKAEFSADFFKVKNQISDGFIDKAVVMTSEMNSWAPTFFDQIRLTLNLLQNCPSHLFIYSHWDGHSKGVIGASPEYLFYRNGRQIHSMALAGTLAKGNFQLFQGQLDHLDFAKSQLLNNEKELLEHQFVVDDLMEKFSELQVKAKAEPLQIVELPHLYHLQTKIQIELDEVPKSNNFDLDLTTKLHPSSALGLRSKKLHWHWLKELNGHQALGHYGAPIGFQLPVGFLCLVGIRNLEWNENGSYLRAGCGIVSQSHAESEWQELEAKRDSVKTLLGLI